MMSGARAVLAGSSAEPSATPHSAAARARRQLSAGYVLVQEQKECNDDGETNEGAFATLQECADVCAATSGCVNFIYGRDDNTRCYDDGTCQCYTVRATAPLPPPQASHAYLSSRAACVSLTAHSSRRCYTALSRVRTAPDHCCVRAHRRTRAVWTARTLRARPPTTCTSS